MHEYLYNSFRKHVKTYLYESYSIYAVHLWGTSCK